MKSPNEHPQVPQSRRAVLFRSGAAAGIVIAVLAVAALLPKDGAPGASVDSGFDDAATSMIAPPAESVPEHVRESDGTDQQYPHEYAGQPSVF